MKRFLALAIVFGCAVMGAVAFFSDSWHSAYEFYGKNIRASLFSGLLTLGSFLLSLKVFIVVKYKETVFDTEWYKKRLEDQRKLDPNIEHYKQVRNLSAVLFTAIASTLVASISQITVGLIEHWAALTFCVFAASFSAAMLIQALLLIRMVLWQWLDETEMKPGASNKKTSG